MEKYGVGTEALTKTAQGMREDGHVSDCRLAGDLGREVLDAEGRCPSCGAKIAEHQGITKTTRD
jgi:hypothetical protein